jgi:calcium-dependent protein kinase
MHTYQRDIREDYHLGKVIGQGHFGTVRIAKQITSNKKFAVKTIEKRKVLKDLHILKREVEILQTLDHPNLLVTFATYEDMKYLHIVTELCTGGELYDKLIRKTRYKERGAAKIMRQILLAVNHLHEHGICHRDLKPENFLFVSPDKKSDLKLIDFGLANKFGSRFEARMNTMVGTPSYVAPEVLTGAYGPQCDIWSAGVIMYMVLSGRLPFEGNTTNEIFKKIMTNSPKFSSKYWKNISHEAKDLITKMLSRVPTNRPSASEVLRNPWFQSTASQIIHIDPAILESLVNYKMESKFKQEALSVIVKNLSIEEIKELKEAFNAMDTGNTGDLTFQEVETALKMRGYNFASDKIAQIMDNTGMNALGRVNYSDFVRATISSKKKLVEQKLWEAFKVLDADNSGYITSNNLKQAFDQMGKHYDQETLQGMIREADIEKDNQISFDEFKQIFNRASV